jgi:hypothetical protein
MPPRPDEAHEAEAAPRDTAATETRRNLDLTRYRAGKATIEISRSTAEERSLACVTQQTHITLPESRLRCSLDSAGVFVGGLIAGAMLAASSGQMAGLCFPRRSHSPLLLPRRPAALLPRRSAATPRGGLPRCAAAASPPPPSADSAVSPCTRALHPVCFPVIPSPCCSYSSSCSALRRDKTPVLVTISSEFLRLRRAGEAAAIRDPNGAALLL